MRSGSRGTRASRYAIPDEIVVRAFATRLRQDSVALAECAEATFDGSEPSIAAVCTRLETSERVRLGALEVFAAPVLALSGGKLVWTYDDDGVHGPSTGVPAELVEQLRRWAPERIHVLCFGSWKAFVDVLQRHGALEATTHLVLASNALDAPLPKTLRSLAISRPALGSLDALATATPALQSLTFLAQAPGPSELPTNLHLRHLGLWHRLWSHELDRLVAHPVVAGLRTLDLFAIEQARHFPWNTLSKLREALAHLHRIFVPGHGVEPEVRRRFEDWPEVVFVRHDRLETLGFDVATLGFPRAFR